MKTENKKTNIPEGWTMTTLGDIAEEITYGYTESAKKEKIGPKFLRITDIQDDFIDWKTVPYCFISEKDYFKYKLEIGDIVIARTGNSTGAISTIKEEVNAVFASYLIRFKINQEKADYKFIDLLLRSETWKNFVKSIKGGSAQGGANAKNFAKFSILFPILPEQQAIAAILSSLDDKIELLREQNKTLEAIAQAIYKRWFVDFEFPIEDETSKLPSLKGGEPEGRGGFDNTLQLKGYKSSGGKMVESELGEIPEGWEVIKINELFDFIKGVEPGSANYFKYKISDYYIPFYRVQNISDNSNVPNVFIEKSLSNNKLFDKKDILVSLDGTIGKVFIGGQGSYSSGIRKVISKNNVIGQCLIYCFLKSDYFQNGLILFSSGETTIKHAGKTLENLQIAYKHDIFEQFTKNTNSIFEKMIINLKQIQTLSALRDSLLPKLMSGKIRVPVKNEAETTLLDGDCHSSLTEEGLKSENPQTEGE